MIKISPTKVISERYCRIVGERKKAEDTACKEIKIAKYFYCDQYGERPSVVVCLYRQGLLKRKPEDGHDNRSCPCSQGMNEVVELQRGRNLLIEHEYIKRKLPPLRNGQ